jgi:PPOX class probable F420-dependent enzyme
MDRDALVQFVRTRGLAVLATVSVDGHPQAAVVGVAVTDDGDIVLDTTRNSRKFANLNAHSRVALTVGFDWSDEQTVQLEGSAAETGRDSPAVAAYYEQFPAGRERAASPDLVYVRIRPDWGRYSDYRPGSFGTKDIVLAPPPPEG